MKVSIIIPVYNLEKYIGKAIDSCLRQNYADIEVIVVNDGSTDNSEKVIESYLADPRVVYVPQENGGVSAARNAGVSRATGDYITFLDGDDYLALDTISENVKYIQSQTQQVDWVLFPMVRVDENGKQVAIEKDFLADCRYTDDEQISAKDLFLKYEEGKVAPIVCAALYSRKFFDVKFPPGRYEDTYVFLQLIQKNPTVLISTKGMYYYVDRGDSFIRTKFDGQKWYDYTRTRIMHIQTGLKINAQASDKYRRQATKTYYNLKYLKNKYHNDSSYARPLQLFLTEIPTVDHSVLDAAKCMLKSLISKIIK